MYVYLSGVRLLPENTRTRIFETVIILIRNCDATGKRKQIIPNAPNQRPLFCERFHTRIMANRF